MILIGFGLLHFCLWSGDILALYALCGFLLILFRNAADRLLLTLAAILILLPVPYYGAMWLSDGRLDPSSPLWELGMGAAAALDIPNADIGQGALLPVLKNGGFFDQLRVAYPNALMRYGEIIFEGRMFKVFGVFLIGLWVGRRLGAVSILDDTHMLRRVFWIGLLVGLPANLLLGALTMMGGTWPYSGLGLAQTAVGAVGVVPLALAYAAGFAMLWQRSSSQRYIGWLAPVGRLALTNYIGQTVFGVVLFFGTGLGLMGTMGAFVTTVLALVFFSAQTGMSIWWSRRFRFGPLEWVWRQLTYGKRFPIRHHVVKPTGAG